MVKNEIRPATLEDCHLLIQWANSQDSLRWKKLSKNKISERDHNKWLRSRLSDTTTQISIIITNGVPSGQVRLEKTDDFVYVDIFTKADVRQKGIASFALNSSIKNYTKCFGGQLFCAVVHSENIASKKLFLKNGFQQDANETGEWFKFFKVIR